MAKRKGSSAPRCSRARKKAAEGGCDTKDDRDASEAENAERLDKLPPELWEKILDHLDENDRFPLALSCRFFRQKQKELVAQRLDKLPPELWEKILDHLDENDLFPLALSCRYFRQKQKELVVRSGQHWPESEPRPTLMTSLERKLEEDEPASADYLRFCSKEKVSEDHDFGECFRDIYVGDVAAHCGYLPLLQELHAAYGVEWLLDSEISKIAARGRQLEILQWLNTHELFDLNAGLFCAAAEGGHLEILTLLRSEGCPWNAETCWKAAREGHLEALKWLRSQDPPCPWEDTTCYWAAWGGHVDVLKWWAIDNGCPYVVDHYTRPALEELGLA